jgi:hypothetical protein
MSRESDFDNLFDRLEAAIIKSRAMNLTSVNSCLLDALDETIRLLADELHRRASQERSSASKLHTARQAPFRNLFLGKDT